MIARWSYVWAWLFLVLHICGVVASPLRFAREETTVDTATMASTATTVISKATDTPHTTHKSVADTAATVTSTTSFPSAINGNTPDNTSSLASPDPIPEGQLPLEPKLTPGWGVAGAILLITGAAYTLVGIRNKWLQTFFSAAFLASLSVTVLIVYVMTLPVPAGIQGAYVVAAVVAGLIIGGAAIVFREITEGLGCLLGGFCFSMWLLTLKPGGLLPEATPKIIFIAAFTVGGYGFYFSHYTRPYALMGLMSFAGATVTVLGIDAYSRAGLKEFWAYIWDLHNGLFPSAANTYPLTKGIRVEIALTVVFAIIGVISQVKLWRVIQERRAKKTEAQLEEQRKRDEEEAALGLQIEEQNARERRQWETVYGDPPARDSADTTDSGVDAMDDEKKDLMKQPVVHMVSPDGDHIEMADLPASDSAQQPADGIIMTNENDQNKESIKVVKGAGPAGHEDVTLIPDTNEKIGMISDDNDARLNSVITSQPVQAPPKPPGPEITPLPFKIPDGQDVDDSRSSVAADADEDNDGAYTVREKPSRYSLTNRLSVSSVNLLQSLSPRTKRSQATKGQTGEFEAQQFPGWAGSTEELIKNPKRQSDVLSIAATIDDLSNDGDAYDSDTKLKPLGPGQRSEFQPTTSVETVGTDVLNSSSGVLSKQSTRKTDRTEESTNPTDINGIDEASETSRPSKSVAPSTTSASVSLTKERLPSALPRVALSYRTNEWAKHLSIAEVPQVEKLLPDGYADGPVAGKQETEAVFPNRAEELQQTTDSTALAEPAMESPSGTSRPVSPVASHTSPPIAHIPTTLSILTSAGPDAGAQANPMKPVQANLPQAGHSFRNKGRRKSNEVYNQPIQEEHSGELSLAGQAAAPIDVEGPSAPNSIPASPIASTPIIPRVVSWSGPQTLLGKREMFLRNKSQTQLFSTPLPIQENPEYVGPATSQMMSPPFNYTTMTTTTPPPPSSAAMAQYADDIPLSQRKQLMRQNSTLSTHSITSIRGRAAPPLQQQQGSPLNNISQRLSSSPNPAPPPRIQTITAESSKFDSHQPQRGTSRVSQAQRDARLSQFRQSVAADLRTAAPTKTGVQKSPARLSSSNLALLSSSNSNSNNNNNNNAADIGRVIDQQREAMMSQREQEAQRRELERWEKERNERAFVEMMQRGDLMDAHREALRKMQGGVRHE